MTLLFLALDKSMPGWFPKTSKLGGLSNCAHDPRKPVTLGTMLKNAAEFDAEAIVHDEIFKNPEQKSRKKH